MAPCYGSAPILSKLAAEATRDVSDGPGSDGESVQAAATAAEAARAANRAAEQAEEHVLVTTAALGACPMEIG